MSQGLHATATPELPNLVTIAERLAGDSALAKFLARWEDLIFSLLVILILTLTARKASKRLAAIPNRLQGAFELFVSAIDDFATGIMGRYGRRFTPFIGTLFIYILSMNLIGLIPLMKSPTSSWSTTLALAICVFAYVQYTALKELGFIGYVDHLLGKPRGMLAFTAVIPILMLILHVVSELVRPISLSLRLRSNVWGDDILLAVLAKFGLAGVPLLLFNTLIIIIAALVQAVVFTLLTTIYITLVLPHEETEH